MSRGGYIKRSPLSLYRAQRRGGKGRIGMQTKEEDIVEHLFVASTHAYVLVFTDRGRLYWLKVHQIPEVASNARGKAIVNLLPVEQNENVRALLTTRDFTEGKYVVMATRAGKIKKTELAAFSNVRASRHHRHRHQRRRRSLRGAPLATATTRSSSARTTAWPSASTSRTSGRWAAAPPACKAISLREDDHVVEMDVLPAGASSCRDDCGRRRDGGRRERAGSGRRRDRRVGDEPRPHPHRHREGLRQAHAGLARIRLKHRGGIGVIDIKTTDKNGKVAGIAVRLRRRSAPAHHRAGDDHPHQRRASAAA